MSKPLYENAAAPAASPNDFNALRRRIAAKAREREAYRQFAQQQAAAESRQNVENALQQLETGLGLIG